MTIHYISARNFIEWHATVDEAMRLDLVATAEGWATLLHGSHLYVFAAPVINIEVAQ